MATKKQRNELNRIDQWLVSALKFDVDTVAQKFCQNDDELMDLKGFKNLLSELEFPTIFLGRLSSGDLVEFSENLLIYAAHFMFVRPELPEKPAYVESASAKALEDLQKGQKVERSLKERIFGIYMSYYLYFSQPHPYVIPIRVSVQQMDSLQAFMNEVLMPEEHFEAVYCLFRLIDSNAFSIVPFTANYNPLLQRKFDFHELDTTAADVEDIEEIEDFVGIKAIGNDLLLMQGDSLHKRYLEEKAKLGCLAKGLSVLGKETPLEYVSKLLAGMEKSLGDAELEDGAEEAADGEENSAHVRRSKIRQNAFAQTTHQKRHRRHRQPPGVENPAAQEWADFREFGDEDEINVPQAKLTKQKKTGGKKGRPSAKPAPPTSDPVEAAIMEEIEEEMEHRKLLRLSTSAETGEEINRTSSPIEQKWIPPDLPGTSSSAGAPDVKDVSEMDIKSFLAEEMERLEESEIDQSLKELDMSAR